MKSNIALLILCISVSCTGSKKNDSISKDLNNKPNVLFILADDLGWSDLGCYGSTFYETPSLDKLAKNGARFTDAYASSPVCSPSRAAIMSGKNPVTLQTTDWFGAPQPDEVGNHWTRNKPLLPAPYIEYLDTAEVTLAEVFRVNGYQTFFAGKWHLGESEIYWPLSQGFDVNIAGEMKGNPGQGGYFSPYKVKNITNGPEGEYLPFRLADETSSFIIENQDQPFFAYLSFYLVHTPLETREELIKKYERKKKSDKDIKDSWGKERNQKVRETQSNATYAAMVESLDTSVGKVVNTLDSLGLLENTVIIFTSDNGGLSTSEGQPTSNVPLRAGKGWLYEGGIREPLIMHFPNEIKPNTVVNQTAIGTDYYETLVSICDLDVKMDDKREGIDLMNLMNNLDENRDLFWHYPHYGNQGGSPGSAIRSGDWKLIRWYTPGSYYEELFNLENDISEQIDLSKKRPEKVKELSDKLNTWLLANDAKIPNVNPNAKK